MTTTEFVVPTTTDWPDWSTHRRTVGRAVRSSLHCVIATTGPDGTPHVTPIGSVVLTEPGRGIYLEIFASRLGRNLDHDPRFCLLAVDSSKGFWLESLVRGRFTKPPGIRLTGTAGPRREATEQEQARFRRQVAPLRMTRGHRILWTRGDRARDLYFDAAIPLRLGAMTAGTIAAT